LTPSLISSQLAWELEGSNGNKMAGKRRSSVLDDLGSGGLMHRIRQKDNLYSQGSSLSKHKRELDSSAQRLLVSSKPEQKASKAIVENGETSKHKSGYASVPTESTQNGIWWRGSYRSRRNGGYSGGWTCYHFLILLYQVEYFLYADETEDEEEYVEETIQDAIMIAAAKTSCI
nr:nuclear pore complex protein NUP1-like [Tanacetum cinerariifolium]